MKTKIIFATSILALSICHNALSAPDRCCKPCYIGAELGGCNLHYTQSDHAEGATSIEDKGFAGRLLAGFDINQNIALELGYTRYQNPEFKFQQGVSADFSQQSLDFLAKISLPVSSNVSVYAKGGMAYVHRDDAEVVTNPYIIKVNEADNHLRPMLGLGISYGFNARVAGNIGYYRTFGTEDLKDADFYGAGITFRIG